jgi:hypothetical protein
MWRYLVQNKRWLDGNGLERDERDIYVLTNMHNPPATKGNFRDEHWNALKPQIVQDNDQHMGYTDKGDRMTNSHSIQWQTWKWTKIFFPPVRHDYCEQLPPPDIMWCQKDTQKLWLALVWNLITNAGSFPYPGHPIGRPATAEKKVTQFEVNFSNHWPIHSSRVICRTCSTQRMRKRVQLKCKECDVGMCTGECFEVYHKKKYKLWRTEECW